MFKRLASKITDKVMSTTNIAKAAAGSMDAASVVSLVRCEVVDVVKQTVAHYFIWMNIMFGLGGFAVGCLLMSIIL